MTERRALLLPLRSLPVAVGPPQPWIDVVAAASDPCLVLDRAGEVVAASAGAGELVGRPVADIVGRALVPEVLKVIDFSAAARPGDDYVHRIAPLLVLRSGAPARGLLRIQRDDGTRVTLDSVAAPLHDPAGLLLGSVAFLVGVRGS